MVNKDEIKLGKDTGKGKSLSFMSGGRRTGQSILWKSLQSTSRNPDDPDIVTTDENGDFVPIENVDRHGKRIDRKKTRPFMPSALVHRPGKSGSEDVEEKSDD